MSRSPQNSLDAGFTLVEALIAAAVLAMVSALMTPALLGAIDAAGRSQTLTAKIEERAALQGVLEELFASAHARSSADADTGFSGSASALSLLVRPEGGRVHMARLELDSEALVLSMAPVDRSQPNRPDPSVRVVLAEGFEAGRLSYIGLEEGSWARVDQSRWEKPHPPRLVILRLDWPDGTQTRIQALVAGQGRFDCRFDSGRGLCLGDSY